MPKCSDLFGEGGEGKVFIPFIMAGDPDLETSLQFMHTLVQAGASIIEVGLPFSDPSADGQVIQKSAFRSLKNQTTAKRVIELVDRFRTENRKTPVIVMTYLNPIMRYGLSEFCSDFKKSGGDALLLVDYTIQKGRTQILGTVQKAGLESVLLVTPNTPKKRVLEILSHCNGFIYYVSVRGITGSELDMDQTLKELKRSKELIRECCCELGIQQLAVVVGFGISNPDQAKILSEHCDGIVIGSKIVTIIQENSSQKLLSDFCKKIKNAISH